MALFIAGLELFDLASFLTEHRTREIGIRKALDSSVAGIVSRITKDFTRLVFYERLVTKHRLSHSGRYWHIYFRRRTCLGDCWTTDSHFSKCQS